MIRMWIAVLAVLADCAGMPACSRPAPQPSPPPTGSVRVYLELVECGALAPTDGGPLAIMQEHTIGDMPFLGCMYEGGTAQSCHAPCGDP